MLYSYNITKTLKACSAVKFAFSSTFVIIGSLFAVTPRIFSEEEELRFIGNNRHEILVPFQSRFIEDTTVTWLKNDIPLSRLDADIQQRESAPPNFTTTLILNPATRNDSGKYRVSVENQFSVIPRNRQITELCLRVRVLGES